MILGFMFGWCFSEAYLTGPTKHYMRGYKAAIDDVIAASDAEAIRPILKKVITKLESTK